MGSGPSQPPSHTYNEGQHVVKVEKGDFQLLHLHSSTLAKTFVAMLVISAAVALFYYCHLNKRKEWLRKLYYRGTSAFHQPATFHPQQPPQPTPPSSIVFQNIPAFHSQIYNPPTTAPTSRPDDVFVKVAQSNVHP